MASLSEVTNVLKEINAHQEERADERHEDLKKSFAKNIEDLSNKIGGRSGLRLPSLPNLNELILNNPISRMISSIKDSITSLITAPYRLLSDAITGLKSAFTSAFFSIGKILKAPFALIKNILPSSRSDQKSLELLEEINSGVKKLNENFERGLNLTSDSESNDTGVIRKLLTISNLFYLTAIRELRDINTDTSDVNSTLESYIETLERNRLDRLESERESNRDSLIDRRAAPTPPGDQPPAPGERQGIFSNIFAGGLPRLGLLGGIGIAGALELFGLDKFVKALMLPDLFKDITKGIGAIAKVFTSLTTIKLPNLSSLKIVEKITDFTKGLGRFFDLLLGPLKKIIGFLRVNPITLALITAFDFISGAIKGFSDAEGDIKDKLWGALEGGLLGIVKGITEGIDLILFDIPGWIAKKLGFEEVGEMISNISITDQVDELWANTKETVQQSLESVKEKISGIGTVILNPIETIRNRFGSVFDSVGNMIDNIPDQLYIAAQKYLRISMPEISVDLPKWLGGGKFTLIPSFSVGFGSAEGAEEARNNIETRNAELIERRRALESQSSSVLERSTQMLNTAEDRLTTSNAASAVQANIDARQTQNNTTVMNQGAFPLPVDVRDPVRMPL